MSLFPHYLTEVYVGETHSQDDIKNATNGWYQQGVTVTKAGFDPEGAIYTNLQVRDDTSTGYHRIYYRDLDAWLTVDPNDQLHLRFYVRQIGADHDLRIYFYYDYPASTSRYIGIDFSAGTLGGASGMDGEITSAGGSPLWYYVDIWNTSSVGADVGSLYNVAFHRLSTGGSTSYTGSTANGMDLYMISGPDRPVDVSSMVEEIGLTYGRTEDTQRSVASTAELVLFDDTEDFNNRNVASTYHRGFDVMQPVKIRARHDWGLSTDVANNWSGASVTVTGGQSDPDGGTNAYLVTETATTAYHYRRLDISGMNPGGSITTDADLTNIRIRFDVKQYGTDKDIRFYFDADTNTYATFDFSAGDFSAFSTGISGRVDDLGSGWYGLEIWNDSAEVINLTHLSIYLNAGATYLGTVSDGVYLYFPDPWAYVDHYLFRGYVTRWETSAWLQAGAEQYRTKLTVADEFIKMAANFPTYSADTSTYDPIGDILLNAGYPASFIDTDTFGVAQKYPAADGSQSLADIMGAATGELGGYLYFDHRANKIRWESFSALSDEYYPRGSAQSTINGDLASLKVYQDVGTIFTRYTDPYGTSNATFGQARFGIRDLTAGGDYQTAGAYGIYNQFITGALGRPRMEATLAGGTNELVNAQLLRFIWDRVTVQEATGQYSDYAIEMIEHRLVQGSVPQTKWNLWLWDRWLPGYPWRQM